jgi:hypothetical protein
VGGTIDAVTSPLRHFFAYRQVRHRWARQTRLVVAMHYESCQCPPSATPMEGCPSEMTRGGSCKAVQPRPRVVAHDIGHRFTDRSLGDARQSYEPLWSRLRSRQRCSQHSLERRPPPLQGPTVRRTGSRSVAITSSAAHTTARMRSAVATTIPTGRSTSRVARARPPTPLEPAR